MDTILDALQEGRLFELPESDKLHSLQFLAHVIEAFPETPDGTDIVGQVLKREETMNTSLGNGWACPHARVPFDEDLRCVIGWSPGGIQYGASDGRPVHLVLMYLIPDNQRNHYLREISILAKAIQSYTPDDAFLEAATLDQIRSNILDLIEATKGTVGPDSRAKMIRLQKKTAGAELQFHDLSNLIVEPVMLVSSPGMAPLVLGQNGALIHWLDTQHGIVEKLESEGVFQNSEWRLLRRGTTLYQFNRIAYDCLAIRINHQ